MTHRALFALLLVGCGGAPFAGFDPPNDDAGHFEVSPEDAGRIEHDAGTPDARLEDAGPRDARNPSTPDGAAACAPVVWAPPADGSAAGPFVGCFVNETPSQLLPNSYAVQTTRAAGCFLETTPLACRCATTYSCVCLRTSGAAFCNGDALVKCDDSAGGPIITCQ